MSSTGQAIGYVVGAVVGFYTGGASYVLMGAAIGGAIGGALDPPKGPRFLARARRICLCRPPPTALPLGARTAL